MSREQTSRSTRRRAMWADQQQEQQRWAPKRRAPWSNLYRCSETLDFDVIHPLPGNRLVYQVGPALPGREPLVPLFLPVFASRVLRLPWQVPVARGVSWARAGPGTDSQGRTVSARGQWPASNRSVQGRGGGRWGPEREEVRLAAAGQGEAAEGGEWEPETKRSRPRLDAAAL